MLRSKCFAGTLLTAVLLVASSQPARAQLTKINVGYSAISGDALPAWLAKWKRNMVISESRFMNASELPEPNSSEDCLCLDRNASREHF